MSKKLTGVITAALIVGAMGTTFAASNPFSDYLVDIGLIRQ